MKELNAPMIALFVVSLEFCETSFAATRVTHNREFRNEPEAMAYAHRLLQKTGQGFRVRVYNVLKEGDG